MVAELKWAGMRWCFASLLSQTLWLVMPTAWAEDKDLATAGVSVAQESLRQCADKAGWPPSSVSALLENCAAAPDKTPCSAKTGGALVASSAISDEQKESLQRCISKELDAEGPR
jgi:hypothetical protein